MSTSRWILAASFCSLVALPTRSTAQVADSTKENAQDFVHDVLRGLLGPHWNVFLGGGFTTDDRFLLQRAAATVDGERALESATGFNISGGAGVDILMRMGLRASYAFRSNQLDFKTNDGNGSNALDIDDVGRLKSSVITVEVMRYMLPSRAAINPYGTLGLQATWWSLDSHSPLVSSNGAGTPFGMSPVFSFGVQFKATNKFSGRLEASLYGGRNPFTGNQSFRATSGPTIDEPSGVNHTDYRLSAVYHFGKRTVPTASAPVAHR
jgi:hypothetical protein